MEGIPRRIGTTCEANVTDTRPVNTQDIFVGPTLKRQCCDRITIIHQSVGTIIAAETDRRHAARIVNQHVIVCTTGEH